MITPTYPYDEPFQYLVHEHPDIYEVGETYGDCSDDCYVRSHSELSTEDMREYGMKVVFSIHDGEGYYHHLNLVDDPVVRLSGHPDISTAFTDTEMAKGDVNAWARCRLEDDDVQFMGVRVLDYRGAHKKYLTKFEVIDEAETPSFLHRR